MGPSHHRIRRRVLSRHSSLSVRAFSAHCGPSTSANMRSYLNSVGGGAKHPCSRRPRRYTHTHTLQCVCHHTRSRHCSAALPTESVRRTTWLWTRVSRGTQASASPTAATTRNLLAGRAPTSPIEIDPALAFHVEEPSPSFRPMLARLRAMWATSGCGSTPFAPMPADGGQNSAGPPRSGTLPEPPEFAQVPIRKTDECNACGVDQSAFPHEQTAYRRMHAKFRQNRPKFGHTRAKIGRLRNWASHDKYPKAKRAPRASPPQQRGGRQLPNFLPFEPGSAETGRIWGECDWHQTNSAERGPNSKGVGQIRSKFHSGALIFPRRRA